MSMTIKLRVRSLYSMDTKHEYNVYSQSIGNCTKHCHATKTFIIHLLIVLYDTVENACRASKDIDDDADTRHES